MKENNYRISIVGTSGSGKSTLARKVSDLLECDHIEMDCHLWLPEWQKNNDETFVETVSEACARENWVACGNYSLVRDHVWKKSTHLVWLKLPFVVVFWQVFWRTMKNIFRRRPIAGGNIETIKQQFFSKNSIFLWVINTHRRRNRVYSQLIEEGAYPNLKVSVLRSNKQVRNWLKQLEERKI